MSACHPAPKRMKTFRIWVGGQDPDVEADCETSLFAAMARAGIAWPVSCRNRTCRMCIARLLKRQVRYDIPWPGLRPRKSLKAIACHTLPCQCQMLSSPRPDTESCRHTPSLEAFTTPTLGGQRESSARLRGRASYNLNFCRHR